MNKPPVGPVPRWIHDERRMWHLIERLAGYAYEAERPAEHRAWLEELHALLGPVIQNATRRTRISIAEAVDVNPEGLSEHLVEALNRARQSINSEIDEHKRDINLQLERIIELLNTREKNEAEIASLKARIAVAVEEEREACAQVALGCQISETSLSAEWGRQCAAAIRRRLDR